MYRASSTGVVKINHLPTSFFDELFTVRSVDELQNLLKDRSATLERIINDRNVPKQTKKMLSQFLERSRNGKLNMSEASRAIPLLYSMSTRAGGNSLVKWTVFHVDPKTRGLEFSRPEMIRDFEDYYLADKYVKMGPEIYDLLNRGGAKVLKNAGDVVLDGNPVRWARVDYRLARPRKGKTTFAIVDLGHGTVGVHDKDVIGAMHGLESGISTDMVSSMLDYHSEKIGGTPKQVVVAIPDRLVGEKGEVRKDLHGLQKVFREQIGHEKVYVVPYSKLSARPSGVEFESREAKDGRVRLGSKDLFMLYHPDTPLPGNLEKDIEANTRVIGSKEFAVISDKRRNTPFLMAALMEREGERIIVPKKGPPIVAETAQELGNAVEKLKTRFGGSGIVVKLPKPIKGESGRALPSALFANPASPVQVRALERSLDKHIKKGAKHFTTEELVAPHGIEEGGIEMRLYHRHHGRTKPPRRRRR